MPETSDSSAIRLKKQLSSTLYVVRTIYRHYSLKQSHSQEWNGTFKDVGEVQVAADEEPERVDALEGQVVVRVDEVPEEEVSVGLRLPAEHRHRGLGLREEGARGQGHEAVAQREHQPAEAGNSRCGNIRTVVVGV